MAVNNRTNAIITYRNILINLKRMEGTVLQLMRHPQATPEQLTETSRAYAAVHASVLDVQRKLRAKYPTGGYDSLQPWDKSL